LTGYQAVNFYNLSVGEFQCVMLNVRIIQVHLPKAGDRVIHAGLAKNSYAQNFGTESAFMLNGGVKGEFRPRKQADCYLGRVVVNDKLCSEFANGGKATRLRSRKLNGNQFVGYPGRSRGDVMQAVIAHEGLLKFASPICGLNINART
jgi:hypothetical protein